MLRLAAVGGVLLLAAATDEREVALGLQDGKAYLLETGDPLLPGGGEQLPAVVVQDGRPNRTVRTVEQLAEGTFGRALACPGRDYAAVVSRLCSVRDTQ